jgi:hypothetical protein
MQPEDEYKALLDRNGVTVQVKQHLSAHIELIRDVVNYGTSLIPRCLVSSDRRLKDLVVIAVLLRQVVSTLDAMEILMSSGAVYASNLPLRAIFEAAVYLEWILEGDGERKATYYHVRNLRRQKSWANRVLPGSAEAGEFGDLLGRTRTDAEVERVREAAKEQIDAIEKHLSKAKYAAINREFERLRKQHRHEVSWYTPLGVPSFRRIASDVGKIRHYVVIYGGGSEAMHASNYKQHLQIGDGEVAFEPIRHLEGFTAVFNFALSIAFDAYRRILGEYRPGEVTLFNRKYVEKWRSTFLSLPQINYQYEYVKI